MNSPLLYVSTNASLRLCTSCLSYIISKCDFRQFLTTFLRHLEISFKKVKQGKRIRLIGSPIVAIQQFLSSPQNFLEDFNQSIQTLLCYPSQNRPQGKEDIFVHNVCCLKITPSSRPEDFFEPPKEFIISRNGLLQQCLSCYKFNFTSVYCIFV